MYKIEPYHACMANDCDLNTTQAAMQGTIRNLLATQGIAAAVKEFTIRIEDGAEPQKLTHFAFIAINMVGPSRKEFVTEFVSLCYRTVPSDKHHILGAAMGAAFDAIASDARIEVERKLRALMDAMLDTEPHQFTVEERMKQYDEERARRKQTASHLVDKFRQATGLKLAGEQEDDKPSDAKLH